MNALDLVNRLTGSALVAPSTVAPKAHVEGLAALSRSAVALDVTVPGLADGITVRDYQIFGIQYAVKSRRTFIADEMGLGKTIQAMAAVAVDDAFPALFVVPSGLVGNWVREIGVFFPQWKVQVLSGKKAESVPAGADAYIVGYAVVNDWADKFSQVGFKAIVCDESQHLKNHNSRQVKDAKKGVREYTTQRVRGVKKIADSMSDDSMRILLTGTAVTNRPIEYASQLDIIGRLSEFGGFFNFAIKYTGAYNDGYGWDFSGATNLESLNDKMRSSCYIRRMKTDVLTELPEKTRTIVWNELPASIKAVYNRVYKKFLAAEGDEALKIISEVKKFTGLAKIELATNWIDEFLDASPTEKLVVFAHHVDVQAALAARYGGAWLKASMKPADVEQVKKDFMEGDTRVIVCSLEAHSTGHTLTAASNVLMVEMGWVPGTMVQAEDRCHRIGQVNAVNTWWLAAEGTMDDILVGVLLKKFTITDKANNGEPLTEEERKMLNQSVEAMFLAQR